MIGIITISRWNRSFNLTGKVLRIRPNAYGADSVDVIVTLNTENSNYTFVNENENPPLHSEYVTGCELTDNTSILLFKEYFSME